MTGSPRPGPFAGLRRWARQRLPLPQPEIAEIRIRDAVDDFGSPRHPAQVILPLIDPPGILSSFSVALNASVSCDYCSLRAELLTTDLANVGTSAERCSVDLAMLSSAQAADLRELPGEIEPPELEPRDLAEVTSADALAFPWDFLSAPLSQEVPFGSVWQIPDSVDVLALNKLLFTGLAGKKYGVNASSAPGVLQATSGTAATQARLLPSGERPKRREESRTTAADRVLDVFELLLPYLYPPLEPLLAEPMLFAGNRRPYGYQVDGIEFLVEREGALLGDEMGLGKTIQAIMALQVLYRRGKARNAIILCPKSLLGTWEREINAWAPELFVWRVRGMPSLREQRWRAKGPMVFLTTYDTLARDARQHPFLHARLVQGDFDVVILDEVQRIKNPGTSAAAAVQTIKAKYRWGLSGTPLENKVDDVVAIFNYLTPDLFRHMRPPFFPSEISSMIRPYFKRRRIADVQLQLPDKVSEEVWLELTEEQRAAYDQAENDARQRLTEPGTTRVHVFAQIVRLKQICNLDPVSGASCKLEYLKEQLEILSEDGKKALVFSHFPKVTLERIQSELAGYTTGIFDGGLSDTQREMLVERFQNDSDPQVMLMSVKAGGLGLTLTRATHVFHFDHWWNPATALQAEARAHRIGQFQTVFVHHLYTLDTIEERVYALLAEKQHLFDTVIDELSDEQVKNSVTDEELYGLFGLKPPTEAREARTANSDKFSQLSAVEFEALVADLYRKMGYAVTSTPASHDHGVDVVARRASSLGNDHLVIQCKHYPGRTVGARDVRELVGAWQEHGEATRAVLVTSGAFTQEARQLAEKSKIVLIDGATLKHLVSEHA